MDRLRAKVAKELKNYGRRVQYSVFELRITEKQYEALCQKLLMLLSGEDVGNIRIYKICGKCENNISTIGVEPNANPLRMEEEDLFIV